MSTGAAAAGLMTFQLVQGMHQAETMRANAELTREIAQMNAEYAEIDAHRVALSGFSQEARYQSVIDSTLSAQKVAFAAQNIDVSFGTAAEIQQESKLIGELNKIDIVNQAHEKALGVKNQARQIRLQGRMSGLEAGANIQAVQTAAITSTAQTGLGYLGRKG